MRSTSSILAGIAFTAFVALNACSGGSGGGSPGPAATLVPTAPPTALPAPVTITDSGSTDTRAFTLVLDYSGAGTLTRNADDGDPMELPSSEPTATSQGMASAAHTSQIFSDLAMYGPVNTLTTSSCEKSSSFGTSTELTWNGATSGDISCPASTGTNALYMDAADVEKDFGVTP